MKLRRRDKLRFRRLGLRRGQCPCKICIFGRHVLLKTQRQHLDNYGRHPRNRDWTQGDAKPDSSDEEWDTLIAEGGYENRAEWDPPVAMDCDLEPERIVYAAFAIADELRNSDVSESHGPGSDMAMGSVEASSKSEVEGHGQADNNDHEPQGVDDAEIRMQDAGYGDEQHSSNDNSVVGSDVESQSDLSRSNQSLSESDDDDSMDGDEEPVDMGSEWDSMDEVGRSLCLPGHLCQY